MAKIKAYSGNPKLENSLTNDVTPSESVEENYSNNVNVLQDKVEESEDDAPVGVSWKESKDAFNKQEKQRKESVDYIRSKEREKRRKKNEMYVAQKRIKTSKTVFELTKLPDDIVQTVAMNVEKSKDENKPDELGKKAKKKRKKSSQKKANKEKYCDVVVVKDEVNKPKKIQDGASKFLENHLYGDRIQRTSTVSNLTLQSKSFGLMKPALKFSC